MDDFFTAKETSSLPPTKEETFASAIESRFRGVSSMPMSTLPVKLPPIKTPQQPPSPSSAADNNFIAITPSSFAEHLKPTTLILDIRPYHAYSNARLPSSIALTVPSTLLKRVNFSLQRLSMMLPSQTARAKFQMWSKFDTIIVYDADSAGLPPTSNLFGLLRKFRGENFTGTLGYLHGGFQAFWREQRAQVDTNPPASEAEDEEEGSKEPSSSRPLLTSTTDATPTTLMPKRLPMSAFSVSSTTAAGHSPTGKVPDSHPRPPTKINAPTQGNSASNPFYDTVRQNLELEQGITETIPLRLSSRIRRRVQDLPFPWLRSIAKSAAPRMKRPPEDGEDSDMSSEPSTTDAQTESSDSDTSPTNTRRASDPVPGDGAEALAMQFYKLEVAEQRRLMSVMTHHTQESTLVASSDGSLPPDVASKFPFSITAGVEKGAKNRYRHIWPFEHARVRLRNKTQKSNSGQPLDDYVNASYVQPLGTKKRYIATQGPLLATFVDFWTLCWEQDVHVIVMLTQEFEGAMEKCAKYWSEGVYGPLQLKLISDTGAVDGASDPRAGSFFPPVSKGSEAVSTSADNDTIRRVFELTHAGYPSLRPRKIIQLQYLGWSDMNVPDDPRSLLKYLKEVDLAVQETDADSPPTTDSSGSTTSIGGDSNFESTTGIWKGIKGSRPVLLHCSAGVGRTGGFIVIDAILDGIRREMRKESQDRSAINDMQVDSAQSLAVAGESSKSNASSKTPSGPVSEIKEGKVADVQMDVDEAETAAQKTSQWVKDPAGKGAYPKTAWNPGAFSAVPDSGYVPGGFSGGNGGARHSYPLPQSNVMPPSSAALTFPFPSRPPRPEAQRPAPRHPDNFRFVQPSPDRSRTFSAPSQPDIPMVSDKDDAAFTEFRQAPSFASSISSIPPSSTSFHTAEQERSGSGEGSGSGTQAEARSWLGTNLRRTVVSSSPAPMDRHDPPSSMSPQPFFPSTPRSPSPFQGGSIPMSAVTLCSDSSSGGSQGAGLSGFSSGGVPAQTSGSSNMSDHVLDYVVPRTLHRSKSDSSPMLSSYDDPVLTVLQGMREQRMSLVQTLRQYVFIHAAIVEGALQIADEYSAKSSHAGSAGPHGDISHSDPRSRRRVKRGDGEQTGKCRSDGQQSATSGSTASKRMASPTELVQEDERGDVKLAKRPSIKRRGTSSEGGHGRQTASPTPSVRRQRPPLGQSQRTARPGAPSG